MADRDTSPRGTNEGSEEGAPEESGGGGASYDPDKEGYAGISSAVPAHLRDAESARAFAEMVVDTVREGLLVLDLDLRVVAANESFYALFGVDPGETVGRLVYDLGDGQWDLPELRDLLEGVLPHERAFDDYEVDHTFEGIGRRVVLLNGRRMDDHQLILLAVEDVTDRRADAERSRREVRASEAQSDRQLETFGAALGSFEDFVYVLTPDARFTYANRALLDLWGRGLEDTVGKGFAELGYPDDLVALHGAQVDEVVRTRGPVYGENSYTAPDGREGYYEYIFSPVLGPDGAVTAVAGITRDVTERIRNEVALRESERRFRTVADLIPDLLWRAGPEGERVWANRRWAEYTGQTAAEAAGYGWAEAVHPDDRPRALGEATGSDGAFRAEHRVRRHDGAYRWFLVNAAPLVGDDGRVAGWIGASTDVHEERTARETLEARVEERTAQVRALARALTLAEQGERRRIGYLLHDDLQQRLHGLSFTHALLRRRCPGAEAEPLHDRAERTLADATRLTRTLSHEMAPPVLRGDDIEVLLEWVAEQKRDLHGLTVDVDVRGSVSVPDEATRVLLYQLVQELLFNVAKHAGTGRARVVAERVEGGAGEERVRLVVEDEGAGFDPSALGGGGGLGLPTVGERVELVGGRLTVESAAGAGTRVTVEVPSGDGVEG